MVWALFPVDPLPGAQSYYIFRKGTYKVGRKDCDVVIQTDRAISRLHAEIMVDTMSQSSLRNKSTLNISIRDLSKFGTFINKEHQTMPVHSFPNKEATLKDGDLVSFGTGNASFRFCFVSFLMFIGCSKKLLKDKSLQASISSIGARATVAWDPDCTHVLAEESSAITADLINVVVAEKPIVLSTWLAVLAEKSICSEIPSFSNYTATLTLDGVPVKVVEPKVRKNCLEGYTLVLASLDMYMFGDKLASLLRVVGAHILFASELSSDGQTSAGGEESKWVLVIPRKSVPEINSSNQLNSLRRIREMELLVSVLSGSMEASKVEPPPVLLSSSHTTDETIVADSDQEIDTATSAQLSHNSSQHVIKHESPDDLKVEIKERVVTGDTGTSTRFNLSSFRSRVTTRSTLAETRSQDHDAIASHQQSSGIYSSSTHLSQKFEVLKSHHKDDALVTAKSEADDPGSTEHNNLDVIYSKHLIVKDLKQPAVVRSSTTEGKVNFKRFRKNEVQSGNSFRSLIPFAKDPYRESDAQFDANAFLREEKKRKQMEAVAEDLFNSAKGKKRGTSGTSIYNLLTRSTKN